MLYCIFIFQIRLQLFSLEAVPISPAVRIHGRNPGEGDQHGAVVAQAVDASMLFVVYSARLNNVDTLMLRRIRLDGGELLPVAGEPADIIRGTLAGAVATKPLTSAIVSRAGGVETLIVSYVTSQNQVMPAHQV